MDLLKSTLTGLDSFGVPFRLKTVNGNSLYKTPLGGLLTITLYAVSFLYLIYVLI